MQIMYRYIIFYVTDFTYDFIQENMSVVCFVQLRGMIIVSTYLQNSYCHFSIHHLFARFEFEFEVGV